MSVTTRKRIGVALIVLSVVAAAVLHFSRIEFLRLMDSETTGNMTVIHFKLHWSALVLGAVALAGLLFIVLPGRRRSSHRGSSP